MTSEECAARLAGLDDCREIGTALEAEAKAAGLVIVLGSGDDLMQFRGAIHDDLETYDGRVAEIDAQGLFPAWAEIDTDHPEGIRAWLAREAGDKATISAVWCGEGGYLWSYRTDLPHATFDIMEEGEPFCRGIVFALADLPTAAPPMTKAQQAALWKAQVDLRQAEALRWSGLKDPAVLPVPTQGHTFGWVITTFNQGTVEKAWSGPAMHHRGSHDDRDKVSQGGIRLYRSEHDAWIALRISKERQFAAALANLDARIQSASQAPPGALPPQPQG